MWNNKSYKLLVLFFVPIILGSFAMISLAQATCETIVQDAITITKDTCAETGRNEACYGNLNLSLQQRSGTQDAKFEDPGDIISVNVIETLRLDPYNLENESWGISLMRLQANLPDTVPGQNISFVLFGDSNVEQTDTGTNPLQAFYFSSGVGDVSCEEAPNGLLIQTPEGRRNIEFLVNEVSISLSSTAYLHIVAGNNLAINLVEGSADITAQDETQSVPAGARVLIPIGSDLNATGAPSDIEPYDYDEMLNLPIELLDRDIEIAPPIANPSSTSTPTLDEDVASTVAVGDAFVVRVDVTASAESCATQEIPPLDSVLVIDVSGSMDGSPLNAAKGSALNYIDRLDTATDQLAVVTFEDFAETAQSLGQNFSGAQSIITGLDSGGGTAIDAGLDEAYAVLASDARDGAQRAVVLLSDGGSDESSALASANRLKENGTQIISIALGSGADSSLLSQIASNTDDAIIAGEADLSQTFANIAAQLKNPIAIRDLTVDYTINTDQFEILDVPFVTGTVDNDTINWNLPTLSEGQTVTLEFALRALEEGTQPIGSIDAVYGQCLDGTEAELETQVTTEVTVVEDDSEIVDNSTRRVIELDGQVNGELESFEQDKWLVDLDSEIEILTIEHTGSGTDFPVSLITENGTINPIASNDTGNGTRRHIFFLEDIVSGWLLVGTDNTNVGGYDLTTQAGTLDDFDTITLDDDPTSYTLQSETDIKVYLIEGVDAQEDMTLSLSNNVEYSYFYGYIITPDNTIFDTIQLSDDYSRSYVFRLDEEGPYFFRLEGDPGPVTIQAQAGDQLTIDRGEISFDEPIEQSETSGKMDVYTIPLSENLEDGDIITISIDYSQYPEASPYNTVMFDASGETIYDDNATTLNSSSSGQSYLSIYTLYGDAPYSIAVPATDPYTLTIEEGDQYYEDFGDIAFDESLEVTSEDKIVSLTLPETEEEFVTVRLTSFGGFGYPQLIDADSDFIYDSDYNYSGNTEIYLFRIANYEQPIRLLVEADTATTVQVNEGNTLNVSQSAINSAQSTSNDGPCSVSSTSNVNRRSGPATTFEVSDVLVGGTSTSPTGQTQGADGYVWWQLAEGDWIRSDVVVETGNCTELPEVDS